MFLICLFLAISGYLLWISWSLWPIALICFVFAVVSMLMYFITIAKLFIRRARGDRYIGMMLFVFVFFAVSNLVGVFLPETGFDAVWYHLPLTAVYAHLHRTIFIPELYQSAMPRLGSYLFVFPYIIGRVVGVKLFCYLISVFIPILIYKIARFFLPQRPSLLLALAVFSFHVVRWQASSAYVDLLRTVFELSALYYLLQKPLQKKYLYAAGILVGFGIAAKLVAFFFFPIWVILVYMLLPKTSKKWIVAFLPASLLPILPWLIQSAVWTGNPVFPLFQSQIGNQQIIEQGYTGITNWIVQRGIRLPLIPYYLVVNAEGYTTPLYLFTLPFILIGIKKKIVFLPFVLFSVGSLIVWFFIPPLSVRYALTAVAVFLLLGFLSAWRYTTAKPVMHTILLCVAIIGIFFNIGIRIGANYRDIHVLTGGYPVQTYVQDHSRGIQKGPMDLWYSGYWNRYSRNK